MTTHRPRALAAPGSDDGETMGDLDPTHPLEATVPAARGTLTAAVPMPAAGAHAARRRSSVGRV